VPSVIGFLGADPKVAVASVILGFLPPAATGSWAYRSTIQANQSLAALITAGAFAGGFASAFALRSIPDRPFALGLALFCVSFGLRGLVNGHRQCTASSREALPRVELARATENDVDRGTGPPLSGGGINDKVDAGAGGDLELARVSEPASAASLEGLASGLASDPGAETCAGAGPTLALGAVVGLGSALSGTSGPLLFIPLYLLLRPRTPPATAVALSQVIGVPMALAMTASNAFSGQTVDVGLSVAVGAATSAFVPLGAALVRLLGRRFGEARSSQAILTAISGVVVATGMFIGLKHFL
jgi:uncharacterized membrane protein YfcA